MSTAGLRDIRGYRRLDSSPAKMSSTTQATSLRRLKASALRMQWRPKRTHREPLDRLYPYYAGFAAEFARSVIEAAALPPGARILDPWNGTGTTTLVARGAGHPATGVDLNPVAAMIASAKLSHREDAEHMFGLATDLCRRAKARPLSAPHELCKWLPVDVANHHWTILSMVRRLLATPNPGIRLRRSHPPPPMASFLIACLVRSAKTLANVRRTTNPAWVRPTCASTATPADLDAEWLSALRRFAGQLRLAARCPPTDLIVGDSRALPVQSGSFDFVLTSPPYCTRLDYVANTSFELAALGICGTTEEFEGMRKSSMGTPLTRERALPCIRAEWPRIVRRLLQQIRNHPSADSAGYYFKNHWQYFDDAHSSLTELRRVLKPGGIAVLVLQTSYYKDVLVDLPELYRAMGRAQGFRTARLTTVPVDRVMSQINARALQHLEKRNYEEAVIALQAGSSQSGG